MAIDNVDLEAADELRDPTAAEVARAAIAAAARWSIGLVEGEAPAVYASHRDAAWALADVVAEARRAVGRALDAVNASWEGAGGPEAPAFEALAEAYTEMRRLENLRVLAV